MEKLNLESQVYDVIVSHDDSYDTSFDYKFYDVSND